MRHSRWWMGLWCGLVVILSGCLTNSFGGFGAGTVHIGVAGVQPGGRVTIPVTVTDVSGMVELRLQIDFDGEVAEVVAARMVTPLPNSIVATDITGEHVRWDVSTTSPPPSTLNLEFEMDVEPDAGAADGECTDLTVNRNESRMTLNNPPGTIIALQGAPGRFCVR